MPIQIVITGDHVTDAIAEIQQLASAINGPTEVTHTVQLQTNEPEATNDVAERIEKTEEKEANELPEKLTYKEQDAVVEEMINNGSKDERYDLLTKKRQKAVDNVLNEANINRDEPEAEEDVSDMFDDDAPETPATITADDIRTIMSKVSTGEDGAADQEKLLAIREIFTKHIPQGEDIKVGNIPADLYGTVHDEIAALGA
jgi:hypothetical protein